MALLPGDGTVESPSVLFGGGVAFLAAGTGIPIDGSGLGVLIGIFSPKSGVGVGLGLGFDSELF
jgi:hypothetical protein